VSARDRLDRPAVRVGSFAVGLLAVFALALGAGSLWGPTVAAPDTEICTAPAAIWITVPPVVAWDCAAVVTNPATLAIPGCDTGRSDA